MIRASRCLTDMAQLMTRQGLSGRDLPVDLVALLAGILVDLAAEVHALEVAVLPAASLEPDEPDPALGATVIDLGEILRRERPMTYGQLIGHLRQQDATVVPLPCVRVERHEPDGGAA